MKAFSSTLVPDFRFPTQSGVLLGYKVHAVRVALFFMVVALHLIPLSVLFAAYEVKAHAHAIVRPSAGEMSTENAGHYDCIWEPPPETTKLAEFNCDWLKENKHQCRRKLGPYANKQKEDSEKKAKERCDELVDKWTGVADARDLVWKSLFFVILAMTLHLAIFWKTFVLYNAPTKRSLRYLVLGDYMLTTLLFWCGLTIVLTQHLIAGWREWPLIDNSDHEIHSVDRTRQGFGTVIYCVTMMMSIFLALADDQLVRTLGTTKLEPQAAKTPEWNPLSPDLEVLAQQAAEVQMRMARKGPGEKGCVAAPTQGVGMYDQVPSCMSFGADADYALPETQMAILQPVDEGDFEGKSRESPRPDNDEERPAERMDVSF